ncbi:uncharacterized protein LOC144094166 isoform X3 [Amblyomma americanum]
MKFWAMKRRHTKGNASPRPARKSTPIVLVLTRATLHLRLRDAHQRNSRRRCSVAETRDAPLLHGFCGQKRVRGGNLIGAFSVGSDAGSLRQSGTSMSRGALAPTTAAWLLLGAAFGSPSCHISSRNTTASVSCSDFGSPVDFEHFIQRPLSRPTLSFVLRDSHLERLPPGAFADVSATSLELINVTVDSFEYAEDDNPFAGLRASVENVTFSGRSSLPASWAILSDLQSLRALAIFEAPGRLNLTRDIGLLPGSLRHVIVDSAQVGYVDDLWLAALVNLESLTLRNTDVSELKRSMMPRPAAALKNLDLSTARRSQVPEGRAFGLQRSRTSAFAPKALSGKSATFVPCSCTP